ncbi:MAG TPA: hypothetical protein VMR62_35360 [Bryobacteraceae bacterium]|nr:hypothetical protein [Bryobacteraceae bacterium]
MSTGFLAIILPNGQKLLFAVISVQLGRTCGFPDEYRWPDIRRGERVLTGGDSESDSLIKAKAL